ncbi:MAG: hypothetical protein HFI14_07205 [Lachnospiraceae bacterium]|nr:hypothetical protein [Lachnospiraceae bacterium]
MRKLFRRCYLWFWVRIRLIRLFFLHVEVPDDAMTQEEMLREIKRKSKLT